MSETEAVPPSDTTEAGPRESRIGRFFKPFGHPAVIIAVLALALLGWQWWETRDRLAEVQQELAKRLADSDSAVKENRVLAKQNQDAIQALTAKVGGLEARIVESQSQQAALEAMYQELSRTRDERVLAEVEQAVNTAAQQLQLAGNVEAALIALQGADARLSRADRAQFLPLRKVIARDIDRLKALPMADVPGIALRLESIINGIDGFPLAFEAKPRAEGPEPASRSLASSGFWTSLVREVWSELKQLVRIERTDKPDPGLLAPSNSFFLRENVKLRLINARLALLQRDARTFRDDIRQSREWLDRYFDTRAAPVRGAVATLDQLNSAQVALDVPTLDDTLNTLRNFKLARERGPGR